MYKFCKQIQRQYGISMKAEELKQKLISLKKNLEKLTKCKSNVSFEIEDEDKPNYYSIKIEIVADEEGDVFGFYGINEIYKSFGSKKINIGSVYKSGGCDTCDYGASSTIDFTVNEVFIEGEVKENYYNFSYNS